MDNVRRVDTGMYDNHVDEVSIMGVNECSVVADQHHCVVFVVDGPSAGLSRWKGDKLSGSIVRCACAALDGDVDDVRRVDAGTCDDNDGEMYENRYPDHLNRQAVDKLCECGLCSKITSVRVRPLYPFRSNGDPSSVLHVPPVVLMTCANLYSLYTSQTSVVLALIDDNHRQVAQNVAEAVVWDGASATHTYTHTTQKKKRQRTKVPWLWEGGKEELL